jgi:hypothetical protein
LVVARQDSAFLPFKVAIGLQKLAIEQAIRWLNPAMTFISLLCQGLLCFLFHQEDCCIGFVILPAVNMKSPFFWYIMLCSPLNVLEEYITLFFDTKDGDSNVLQNVTWLSTDYTALYHRTLLKMMFAGFFLKHSYFSARLHGVTSQKTNLHARSDVLTVVSMKIILSSGISHHVA